MGRPLGVVMGWDCSGSRTAEHGAEVGEPSGGKRDRSGQDHEVAPEELSGAQVVCEPNDRCSTPPPPPVPPGYGVATSMFLEPGAKATISTGTISIM